MDPLTLLALANGAVAAIKKGCQLYKDVKGAAGDVKEVLKDLDQQFRKSTEGKKVTKEMKEQYEAERNRVIEISKHDPNDIIATIGDQLGAFFDAFDQIEELFWEEERKAKELYAGDVSLSRRALQRVLIRTRLEQMEVELREQMIYHVPADLKDLWTRFQAMRTEMEAQQKVLREKKIKEEAIRAAKRKKRLETLHIEIAIASGILVVIIVIVLMFTWIHYDKLKRWPELAQKGEYRKKMEELQKHDLDKITQAIKFLDEENYKKNKQLILPEDSK